MSNIVYCFLAGSWSVILSRKFIEYRIFGMDNLPRTLLMYYTNMPLPHRKYFQTVLCNSPEFNKTVVNHDLHYSTWDAHSKNEPHLLTIDDVENMTESAAAFGLDFPKTIMCLITLMRKFCTAFLESQLQEDGA
jgi:hypothetical protein